VLFVVGRDPIYAAGKGSHIDSLIDAAGGTNVAADARSPYPQLALEAVLARRPEVILDSSNNAPGAPLGRLPGWWASWPFLPAVAERRVYYLEPARLSVPGPRLDRMVELMAKLVHPEIFGEAAESELGPLAGSTGLGER
jgi:ABC-type Fe3+-hydroxamate transport system substrate-binding protein